MTQLPDDNLGSDIDRQLSKFDTDAFVESVIADRHRLQREAHIAVGDACLTDFADHLAQSGLPVRILLHNGKIRAGTIELVGLDFVELISNSSSRHIITTHAIALIEIQQALPLPQEATVYRPSLLAYLDSFIGTTVSMELIIVGQSPISNTRSYQINGAGVDVVLAGDTQGRRVLINPAAIAEVIIDPPGSL